MRLVLLRHGQTHSNVAGALDTGSPGADLTDLGLAQATAAARVLGERSRPIGAVITSTLVRTQQTAAPFVDHSGLVPVVREGIREVQAGDGEMATDERSVHTYLHTVGEWLDGRLAVRMPGAETGHEFLERYDAVVREAAAHENVLLVSHGAAIRLWVGSQTHVPVARERLHNTGCIEVEGDPDSGWRVVSWHADPLGGHYLEDPTAADPTGQEADE